MSSGAQTQRRRCPGRCGGPPQRSCVRRDRAARRAGTPAAGRAELADGLEILELGCGWGSLTLWMAEKYPHARINGVSNSD